METRRWSRVGHRWRRGAGPGNSGEAVLKTREVEWKWLWRLRWWSGAGLGTEVVEVRWTLKTRWWRVVGPGVSGGRAEADLGTQVVEGSWSWRLRW